MLYRDYVEEQEYGFETRLARDAGVSTRTLYRLRKGSFVDLRVAVKILPYLEGEVPISTMIGPHRMKEYKMWKAMEGRG